MKAGYSSEMLLHMSWTAQHHIHIHCSENLKSLNIFETGFGTTPVKNGILV
jgi:cytosine/adenosine deaminase-related metal-dependent hydrolase